MIQNKKDVLFPLNKEFEESEEICLAKNILDDLSILQVKNNWDGKKFLQTPAMLKESFEGKCCDFGKWPNVSLAIFAHYFGNWTSHFTLEVNEP